MSTDSPSGSTIEYHYYTRWLTVAPDSANLVGGAWGVWESDIHRPTIDGIVESRQYQMFDELICGRCKPVVYTRFLNTAAYYADKRGQILLLSQDLVTHA